MEDYFEIDIFSKFLFKIYDIFGLASPPASSLTSRFRKEYTEIETYPDNIASHPYGGWWKNGNPDFTTCFKLSCEQYAKEYSITEYDKGYLYLYYLYVGKYKGHTWPNIESIPDGKTTTGTTSGGKDAESTQRDG